MVDSPSNFNSQWDASDLIGEFSSIDTSGLVGWEGRPVLMTITDNFMSFVVPEPTTAVLLLAGAVGMLLRRRR